MRDLLRLVLIFLPVQTKIRAVNYIRFKEKLTFHLLNVTKCPCFHQIRLRGQTGFPPSVAVGYTNIDLKTNMLLERGSQEKLDKASMT